MKYEFVRQNEEPIEIEYVEDEHDPNRDFKASFWFEGRRRYIEDYVRTHNNPWLGGEWPEHIHGMESEVYVDPLFIELIGDGEVNVYRDVMVEEERC